MHYQKGGLSPFPRVRPSGRLIISTGSSTIFRTGFLWAVLSNVQLYFPARQAVRPGNATLALQAWARVLVV